MRRASDLREGEEAFASFHARVEDFLAHPNVREWIAHPERYGLDMCSRCGARPMAMFCFGEDSGGLFLFSSCIECLGGHGERETVSPSRIARARGHQELNRTQ